MARRTKAEIAAQKHEERLAAIIDRGEKGYYGDLPHNTSIGLSWALTTLYPPVFKPTWRLKWERAIAAKENKETAKWAIQTLFKLRWVVYILGLMYFIGSIVQK